MGSHINPPLPVYVGDALSAIRRFVRTLRRLDAATERLTELSTAQVLVLQLLADADAKSVNDLAERTMTDQSSVSAVVTRLAAKGLVSRGHSDTDARRTTISITAQGRLILERAPASLQARLVAALQQLPPTTAETLTDALSHLATLLGMTDEPSTFFFEDDATGHPA